jgi:hypothetical protein
MTTLNLAKELAALQRLGVAQLRQRYAEVFGEATRAANRAWLLKRIAWRIQAKAEGGLSERARARAAELADDADLRSGPPKAKGTAAPIPKPAPAPAERDPRLPPVGAVLVRPYKGRDLKVGVLVDGFEFDGAVYPSLSAVTKAATGSHCNGFLFFRLAGGGDA